MYLKCLKTYRYLLRYVFFIMGILFLAVLIGGHLFIENGKKAVNEMADNIAEITENADLSFDAISDAIIGSLDDLTSDEQIDAIVDKGLSGASEDFIGKAVDKVIGNYEKYAEDVSNEIGIAVTKIMAGTMIIIVLQIIAIIIGENAVAILAGKDVLNKTVGLKGNLLNRVCRFAYKLVSVLVILLMLNIVPIIGVLLILAYPYISCYLAVLSRYYLTTKDKTNFSKIVNKKNVWVLFLADLTCIVISFVVSLIVLGLISGFASLYIFVSLIAITNVSVRLNAYLFAEDEVVENVEEAAEV